MPPISDHEWAKHMGDIDHWFMKKNKTLHEVMAIMENTRGFTASEKQYKERLRSSGIEKNKRKPAKQRPEPPIPPDAGSSSRRRHSEDAEDQSTESTASDSGTLRQTTQPSEAQQKHTQAPTITSIVASTRSHTAQITTQPVLSTPSNTKLVWANILLHLKSSQSRSEILTPDDVAQLRNLAEVFYTPRSYQDATKIGRLVIPHVNVTPDDQAVPVETVKAVLMLVKSAKTAENREQVAGILRDIVFDHLDFVNPATPEMCLLRSYMGSNVEGPMGITSALKSCQLALDSFQPHLSALCLDTRYLIVIANVKIVSEIFDATTVLQNYFNYLNPATVGAIDHTVTDLLDWARTVLSDESVFNVLPIYECDPWTNPPNKRKLKEFESKALFLVLYYQWRYGKVAHGLESVGTDFSDTFSRMEKLCCITPLDTLSALATILTYLDGVDTTERKKTTLASRSLLQLDRLASQQGSAPSFPAKCWQNSHIITALLLETHTVLQTQPDLPSGDDYHFRVRDFIRYFANDHCTLVISESAFQSCLSMAPSVMLGARPSSMSSSLDRFADFRPPGELVTSISPRVAPDKSSNSAGPKGDSFGSSADSVDTIDSTSQTQADYVMEDVDVPWK